MKQVVLFLILVFGIKWSLGYWVAAQSAPTSLSGCLAAFLPQVWAPTVISLILVGVSLGARGIWAEVAERLKYRRGSTPWLALAALTPAVATASAVAQARRSGWQRWRSRRCGACFERSNGDPGGGEGRPLSAFDERTVRNVAHCDRQYRRPPYDASRRRRFGGEPSRVTSGGW